MKTPNIDPVDVKIGARLQQIRKMARMSQETLANASGITFQQVQKYEKGTNRISISRLLEFCKTLGCRPMDIISAAGDEWKEGGETAFDIALSQRNDASRKLRQITSIINGGHA